MKTTINYKNVFLLILVGMFASCEDYLEIEAPDDKIISDVVFDSDETAVSAMIGIYNQFSASSFSSGGADSVTILAGLSGDALTTLRTTNLPYQEFEEYEIDPGNFRNYNLWEDTYNIIYLTNSLLEGLERSQNVSEEVKDQLEGEAKFIRAFTYFYLVNLYGEVPLILTTDYRANAVASRSAKNEVYAQIMEDLEVAVASLNANYIGGSRTRINKYAAMAMLARVNLYLQNWNEAEMLSTEVIAQSEKYEILDDLNKVFLANSREALWQLSPAGRGNTFTNTNEGSNLIIQPFLTFLSHLKLEENFVASMEDKDLRLEHWIEFHTGEKSYYPHKYKIQYSMDEIIEYSMVLRLAEQYLIRAEARAMEGDINGAIDDLDTIRTRAGLSSIGGDDNGLSEEGLLDAIMEERKKELFTEWGHRWLDLKRTGRAVEVLEDQYSSWEDSDLLYPIPESDRMKNPSLTQNDGY